MHEASNSLRVADLVMGAAATHGAQIRVIDLHESDLPMFRHRGPQPPHKGRQQADEAVNWADAFFLVTPDYHGTMSGAMKNFLDHYWSEFAGKLFSYGCVSHEKGLTVMEQMRTVIRQCYGWSMPYGLSVNAREDFDESGEIANQAFEQRLQMLARDLTVYGALLRGQFQSDVAGTVENSFAARYRN